ncbi:hypothetical protein J3A83DRAFT_4187140 [Scleroderma citrinum]
MDEVQLCKTNYGCNNMLKALEVTRGLSFDTACVAFIITYEVVLPNWVFTAIEIGDTDFVMQMWFALMHDWETLCIYGTEESDPDSSNSDHIKVTSGKCLLWHYLLYSLVIMDYLFPEVIGIKNPEGFSLGWFQQLRLSNDMKKRDIQKSGRGSDLNLYLLPNATQLSIGGDWLILVLNYSFIQDSNLLHISVQLSAYPITVSFKLMHISIIQSSNYTSGDLPTEELTFKVPSVEEQAPLA